MLSTYVHVDLVASTEQLATHGVDASVARRQQAGVLIAETAGTLGGDIVDVRGDGTLIRFGSAVTALRCAAAIQSHASGGAGPDLRIGVVVDEVENPVEAVTAAEQVERCCPTGAVVFGDRVRRAIATHVPSLDAHEVAPGVWAVAADAVPSEPAAGRVSAVMFTEPVAATLPGSTDEVLDGEAAIRSAGGEIVDSNGRGHVALFTSCASAIAAADALHGAVADRRLHIDGARTAAMRIGLALGEVSVLDGQIVGGAVVEAARLLDHAEPGTSCASAAVAHLARAPHFASADAPVSLKGLPEPVRIARTAPVPAPPLVDRPPRLARPGRYALAGRQRELDQLDRAWRGVERGVLRAVAVSGHEGVGKTRLVTEFVASLADSGAVIAYGACTETATTPFGPIREALSRLAPVVDDIERAERGEGLLAGLFGTSGDEVADRLGPADALASTLVALAARRPVVLVIDDVQWAGADLAELLLAVVSDARDMRLMIVFTCRDIEVDRHHPAHPLLAPGRDRRPVDRVPVGPLDAEAIGEMLVSRTARPLDATGEQFARFLRRVSGGNPLFVEELVSHFASDGTIAEVDGRWQLTADVTALDLPDSILELMAARIDRLGTDAVEVLRIAAVVGDSFDLEVVARVADRSFDAVLDVVEAAADARLVSEGDDGGTCVFGDEIVRGALLRDVRPTRRARVHQRIAEALEVIAPDRVDDLARHWQSAVGREAAERAVVALRRAGERDMASAAWESSVVRHRRILELLAERSDESPAAIESQAEAQLHLGLSLRATGSDGFRPPLSEAGRLARRVQRADLLARAAIAMMRPGAWYPEAATVDEDISAMCEAALLMLDADDPLRPRVLAALATNLAYDHDADRRVALVEEAQLLARSTGDTQLIGTTLVAELLTSRRPDQHERRAELALEISRIGRLLGDLDQEITGGIFLIMDALERGDLADARRLRDELEPVVGRRRTYWPEFLVAHLDGSLLTAHCDPAADASIAAVFERFQSRPVDAFGVWTIQVALRAMQEGRMAELILPLTEMTEDEDEEEEWATKWNYAVAKAHLDSGDPERAREAIALNPDPDFDNYWLVSVNNLGAIGLALDDRAMCEQAVEWLMPYRARLGVIGLGACIGAQVSVGLGEAHLGLGDVDLAEELFREAVDQAVQMRTPYFESLARRRLSLALSTRDPSDPEIGTQLDIVVDLADRFGFVAERAGADELRGSIAPAG